MGYDTNKEKRAKQFRDQMERGNSENQIDSEIYEEERKEGITEEEYRKRKERIENRRELMKKEGKTVWIRRTAALVATAVGVFAVAAVFVHFTKKFDGDPNGIVLDSTLSENTVAAAQEGKAETDPSDLETVSSTQSAFREWQSDYDATKETKAASQTKSSKKKASETTAAETTEPETWATPAALTVMPPFIDQQLLPVNTYSRPGKTLKKVNDIVIHYVGNPGTKAQDNRDYFASLADPKVNAAGTKASSHFVVGLEGEIIQCVPLEEVSYCSNQRNSDTVAIEVCHPDAAGKFTDATYASVVKLTAWLLEHYNLNSANIIRHYDVTGKECPKYYVQNPASWEQLKADVAQYMAQNPNIQ